MGCPPLCMILVHSGWKCVHQIDISVRCIGYKQKNLQIQFYCQPRASPVFSCGEQRCRINGLPDLVYYWASLKGGKKRAPDFDWWVPLSSQITAHPSPFSHVARFLFSHNQLPVASVRIGTWANEERADPYCLESREVFIEKKKQWLELPNMAKRAVGALAITIWDQTEGKKGRSSNQATLTVKGKMTQHQSIIVVLLKCMEWEIEYHPMHCNVTSLLLGSIYNCIIVYQVKIMSIGQNRFQVFQLRFFGPNMTRGAFWNQKQIHLHKKYCVNVTFVMYFGAEWKKNYDLH